MLIIALLIVIYHLVGASHTFYGCTVVFYDKDGNFIRYNSSDFGYGHYLGNNRLDSGSVADNAVDGTILKYNFVDSNTIFFNLPYDVYYIGVFKQLASDHYYYAYNLEVNYFASLEQASFDAGFTAGKSVADVVIDNARESGYRQGLNARNDYTFARLIGSVVDAPINAIFGKIDSDTGKRTRRFAHI